MSSLIVALLWLASSSAPAQQRLASNVVRVYVDDAADRIAPGPPDRPPSNIRIAAIYRGDIDTMLRRSPTFRAQCARIAAADNLRVEIQPSLLPSVQSAITRVTREPGGRLDAEVEIGPLGDAVMLIAHEFEHIIEQLDGVDLWALAARAGTGVRSDPMSGHFETERATVIGRRVAREVSVAVARR